jgi:hypothetical protein
VYVTDARTSIINVIKINPVGFEVPDDTKTLNFNYCIKACKAKVYSLKDSYAAIKM